MSRHRLLEDTGGQSGPYQGGVHGDESQYYNRGFIDNEVGGRLQDRYQHENWNSPYNVHGHDRPGVRGNNFVTSAPDYNSDEEIRFDNHQNFPPPREEFERDNRNRTNFRSPRHEEDFGLQHFPENYDDSSRYDDGQDSISGGGKYDIHQYVQDEPDYDDDLQQVNLHSTSSGLNTSLDNSVRTNDGYSTLVIRKRKSKIHGAGDYDSLGDKRSTVHREIKHLPSQQLGRTKSLKNRKNDLNSSRIRSTHDAATFYRDQILQKPELTGASSWHYHRKKAWQDFKQLTKNLLYQLELWSGAFKTIEGHFGTAVMSYFRFLRWLLFLNLYMTVVMVGLTMIVPLLPLDYVRKNDKNASIYVEQAENCTYQYNEYVEKTRENDAIFNLILDFLQGTGWMERTILFYGKYNETYTLSSSLSGIHTYNMGLIYLLATGIVFVLSFLLILKNSGKGVKESVMEDGNQVTQFCNKVFAGWDFCISNEKAAHEKHKILSHELCSDLESQKLVWRKEGRTTKERTKLYFIRVLINFLIVSILVGCVALIAYVNIVLVQLQTEFGNVHPVVQFLIQFLPSLTITILNFIWPVVFKKLVTFEDYLPAFEMRMTLLRIIMLRLASLLTLVISLYQQLQTTNKDADVIESCGNKRWTINETSPGQANSSNTVIKCWETYVGQQFYKLVVLDFLVVVIVTFLVEYPRRLVHKNLHEKFKLVEMIGQQEFDLPKAVLDIVYTQTLCWMGLFFCPLIPMISFLKCFLLFYIKKGSLLNNCVQPSRPYRTSKSNSLFIGVLFISFILSAGLLSYMIGSFSPSQSCGPFRLYTREHYVFFDAVIDLINTFQSDIRKVIFFFGELAFLVPAAIIVCFFMYSYGALSTGYKRKTKLLKEQLRLEGHDKQFLLARVNEAWQSMEVPASSQQTNILASS